MSESSETVWGYTNKSRTAGAHAGCMNDTMTHYVVPVLDSDSDAEYPVNIICSVCGGVLAMATTPSSEPDEVGWTVSQTVRRFGRRLVFSEPAAPDAYEVYGSKAEAHAEFAARLKAMVAMAAEAWRA